MDASSRCVQKDSWPWKPQLLRTWARLSTKHQQSTSLTTIAAISGSKQKQSTPSDASAVAEWQSQAASYKYVLMEDNCCVIQHSEFRIRNLVRFLNSWTIVFAIWERIGHIGLVFGRYNISWAAYLFSVIALDWIVYFIAVIIVFCDNSQLHCVGSLSAWVSGDHNLAKPIRFSVMS